MEKKTLIIFILIGFVTTALSQTPPIIYVAGDGSGDYNCDGISDQVEINQALDFVALNSDYTTVYLKGQNTFWINEPIYISANTTLKGDSNTIVKLIDNAGWNTQYKPLIGQKGLAFTFGLQDPSTTTGNITIRGFELDGNSNMQPEPSGNSYYNAIILQNCYNITVNDMYIHHCLADALQTGYDLYGFDINLQFYNNRVHSSGHDGIYVTNSKNFEIHDNIFSDNRTDAHIRVQDCNHFKIYNNIGGNNPDRQYSGGIGISMQAKANTPLNNAEIYNNYFYGKGAYHGIWLWQTNGGGTLNTHENVHIHHNIISWYKYDGIRIEGFHNTLIESNIIQSDGGLENQFGGGIVFASGDPNNNVTGFQTTARNNIIVDNITFGVDNQKPSIHTFNLDYNNINGNLQGHYNNTSSVTDIYVAPNFSSTLFEIYTNILSPTWQNAVTNEIYTSALGSIEAKNQYHLKSEIGRWNTTQWIQDNTTSLCVDAGKPTSDFSNEPTPNGEKINIGAFGNTIEASKSDVLSIQDEIKNTFVIKPNPTKEIISISERYLNGKYQIITINGSIIKDGFIISNNIDFSLFKAGIYYLKLIEEKIDKILVVKVIKK